MKYISIALVILSLSLFSCREEEAAWVSIRNSTPYNLYITFVPAINANGFRLQETLDTEFFSEVDIYRSMDESIDPCTLLSEGYNSFTITIASPDTIKVSFSKSPRPGYAFNPFIDSESWVYEKFVRDFPDMGSRNTTSIHNHIFVIEMGNLR